MTSSKSLPPVVEAWAACRTSRASRWPVRDLLKIKRTRTISVVLPARDEQATIGPIVTAIRGELMHRHPLVDELVVVDSLSTDGTAQVAAAAGARVVNQREADRGLPPLDGKGAALWAGLAATRGDLVAFVDADVSDFRPEFVTGLLGPLLADASVHFVKGFYHRPLTTAAGADPDGGGRVTELVARPLLNLFWPELSGFVQPLAGEYAGRRTALAQIPFVSGYGVELAMLIDLLDVIGLDGMAQVDLGDRRHRHQSNQALGRMSAQIMLAAWSRLARRGWCSPGAVPHTALAQFYRGDPSVPGLDRHVTVHDIAIHERPPLLAPV